MDAQLNVQQQMVLDELRAQYEIVNRATETLDSKLTGVFSIASLLLTLFTGLQGTAARSFPYIFGPYPVLVVLLLVALWPQRMRSPIKLEWEVICEEYLHIEDQEAYKRLVSNYLYAIDANLRRNSLKARLLIAAFLLMVVQIAVFTVALYY